MRRRCTSLLVVIVVVFLLTGTVLAEKTKITYWSWMNLDPVIEKFEATHPTIDIEYIKMGPWDIHDKLLVALSAGKGAPDIAELVVRRFSSYTATGQLTDITDSVQDILGGYSDSVVESVSKDGRIYGLPGNISPGVIWYRKDLFEKYGVSTDWETWDDYIAAGKELRKHDVYMLPLFIPAGQWGANQFTLMLNSRGGNLYTPDGKFIRDNEIFEDTLQWYYDLYAKHKIADTSTFFTPEFWGAFKAGRFATWPMNTAEGANIKRYMPELKGQWAIAPFPRWPERDKATTGVWGGTVLTIPKQSKNKEAAIEFIKWFSGTVEGQLLAVNHVGATPAYNPTFEHPSISEGDPYYSGENVFDHILPMEPLYYFDWAETMQIVGNQLDRMFAGQVTPQQAYENIEKEVISRLDR